jgi:hypothetical protein
MLQSDFEAEILENEIVVAHVVEGHFIISDLDERHC